MDFNELSEKELKVYIAQNLMLNQAMMQTIVQNQAEILAHLHRKPQDLVLARLNQQISDEFEALIKKSLPKRRVKIA